MDLEILLLTLTLPFNPTIHYRHQIQNCKSYLTFLSSSCFNSTIHRQAMTVAPTSSTSRTSATSTASDVPVPAVVTAETSNGERYSGYVWCNGLPVCRIAFFIAAVGLIFASHYFFPECRLCRSSKTMSYGDRIVPFTNGVKCIELVDTYSKCVQYKHLMDKIDLKAYCGCRPYKSSELICDDTCPTPSPSPSDIGFISERVVSPFGLSPSAVTKKPSQEPSYDPRTSFAPSTSDHDGAGIPVGTVDEAMCSDFTAMLPFVLDDAFCDEVKSNCCPLMEAHNVRWQSKTPDECLLCLHGSHVLEEKPVASNSGTIPTFWYFLATSTIALLLLTLVSRFLRIFSTPRPDVWRNCPLLLARQQCQVLCIARGTASRRMLHRSFTEFRRTRRHRARPI